MLVVCILIYISIYLYLYVFIHCNIFTPSHRQLELSMSCASDWCRLSAYGNYMKIEIHCEKWLSEIWNVHLDGGWMNKEQYTGESNWVRKEININTVKRWDCRIALGGCIWSRIKLNSEVELEIFHQKGINWRGGVTEALIQVTSQFWIVDR